MMSKKVSILKKTLLLGISMVTFMACGDKPTPQHIQPEPISVKVDKVASSAEGNFKAGSGQIMASQSATLSTRMIGFVDRVAVKAGQKVSKGQLLISIKNTDLQAKKAQAEASIIEAKAAFENAKKDYQRFVNLFDQNSASPKELDDITSRFEMAKARLEATQQMAKEVDAQFAYVNIRAPFGGAITNIHIDEGAMANPGMPLVSIEDSGTFEIEAKVSEDRINQLKVGNEALVHIKALNTTVKGRLTELSPSAQFTGGQYMAKVALKNPPKDILSGMFATISFPIKDEMQAAKTVHVPKSALVEQGQLNGIYTVGPDDTAILRWLRLGEVMGDEVEVLSGLSEEETYIVSAEGKLYNGAKLMIQ